MSSSRKLGTLRRADLGKQITFTCECTAARHVEGVIRAFTHGVFSHPSASEFDVPRVMVTVQALRSYESHWASPGTLAALSADVERGK